MLRLPENAFSVGPLVTNLLRQANAAGCYDSAAIACARAAIDFMLAGPRWKYQQPVPVVRSIANGWQINEWLFYVLCGIEDDVFIRIGDLSAIKADMDVLVPPWSDFLVKHAVRSAFPGLALDVLGIDSFCGLRVMWTSLDMGLRPSACVGEFIRRYQIAAQFDDIKIRIPHT